jgi:hypothetical protein
VRNLTKIRVLRYHEQNSTKNVLKERPMAEIGNPEKRRVLVPDEQPAPPPVVVPERKAPVKVPEKQPA